MRTIYHLDHISRCVQMNKTWLQLKIDHFKVKQGNYNKFSIGRFHLQQLV